MPHALFLVTENAHNSDRLEPVKSKQGAVGRSGAYCTLGDLCADPQHPPRKPGVVAQACSLALEMLRNVSPWGLQDSHPTQTHKCQVQYIISK